MKKVIDTTEIVLMFILLMLISVFNNFSNGQTPLKLWDVFFNGNLNGKDESRYVITDSNGDVYVTGKSFHTSSSGSFTTVKYNSSGVLQWVDHFNGAGSGSVNEGIKLVCDKWDNIYSVGTITSNAGDIAIVKYNHSGKIWAYNYEPYWFGSDIDFGVDIAVDSNSNIYACGQVTSLSGNLWDMYSFKCDSAGTRILEENFSSASDNDYPVGIASTSSGNVFAVVNSFDFWGSGTYDMFTINYMGNWNHNWESIYDGAGNGEDHAVSFKVDNSSNQLVCGTSSIGGNGNDMLVMKQNQYGTTLWTCYYNGTANANDTSVSVSWLPGNLAVVSGRCREIVNSVLVDAIVTMVIDSGTVMWTQKFYGTDNLGAVPLQMTTDELGCIYIAGYENLQGGSKNGCIIKYDSNGNLQWNISYDAGANLDDLFHSLVLDLNNDVIVTGQSFVSAANADYVTVKYTNASVPVKEIVAENLAGLVAYPNPMNDVCNLAFTLNKKSDLKISIYTMEGQLMIENIYSKQEVGLNNTSLSVINLSSGIYIVEVRSDVNMQRTRIEIMR